MKKLLLAATLALTTFHASAFVEATDQERADTSPWMKVGTQFYSVKSFNEPDVNAYLFVKHGHPAIKFTLPTGHKGKYQKRKHKVKPNLFVNGRPVGMTKQNIGGHQANYTPYSDGGDNYLIKKFKNSNIVYLSTNGKKRGAIKFSTKGFNKALRHLKNGK